MVSLIKDLQVELQDRRELYLDQIKNLQVKNAEDEVEINNLRLSLRDKESELSLMKQGTQRLRL